MDWCYYRDLLHASVFKGGRPLYLSSFSMLKRRPRPCGAEPGVWGERGGNQRARLACVSQAVNMWHHRRFHKRHQKHCAWTVNQNILIMGRGGDLNVCPSLKKKQSENTPNITFHRSKQHLKPVHCRVGPQISGLFTFSRSHFRHSWIPAAGQHTVVYLCSPVKRSLDTNSPSHSHALSLRESRSAAPLEFITSQHWLPRHRIVPCGRTDDKLCVWLPRAHAAVGTVSHDFTQRWKVHFFFFFFPPPQHSCHIRCTNPANVTNSMVISSRHITDGSFQQGCVLRLASALQDKTNLATKGKTSLSLLTRSIFLWTPGNITIQSLSSTWHKSKEV